MKTRVFAAVAVCLLVAPHLACRHIVSDKPVVSGNRIDTVRTERDEIYMLLAYAVAHKDWQAKNQDRRGYNIASVLVSPEGRVVSWGRNSNARTKNSTQHGEVRLLLGYLDRRAKESGGRNAASSHLDGYSVFTTLEPCAMCASMMTLLRIERTVYGQSDKEFGRALERLQLDSTPLAKLGLQGYPPYPRPVKGEASLSEFRVELDAEFSEAGADAITDFLYGSEAERVFSRATSKLLNFELRHPENQSILEQAKEFLNRVPEDEAPLKLDL